MKIYKFDESGYFQIGVTAKKDADEKIIVPPGYTDRVPPAAIAVGVRLRFVNGEWLQEVVSEAHRTKYEQKIQAEIRRWAISNLIGLEEIPVGYI